MGSLFGGRETVLVKEVSGKGGLDDMVDSMDVVEKGRIGSCSMLRCKVGRMTVVNVVVR